MLAISLSFSTPVIDLSSSSMQLSSSLNVASEVNDVVSRRRSPPLTFLTFSGSSVVVVAAVVNASLNLLFFSSGTLFRSRLCAAFDESYWEMFEERKLSSEPKSSV